MSTLVRLIICLLMAIFINEAIMIGLYDQPPNITTSILSLLLGSFMLFMSLFKSIVIEHVEMMMKKEKDKR